jgi:hypothetical protein
MATVKIETAVVIEALEQALNKLHAEYAMQNSLEIEYQRACAEWKKEVIAYAVKHIETATDFRTNYRPWANKLNIDYDVAVPEGSISESPSRKYESISEREYKEQVVSISKELRILKLTKDEYVSASTLKSVGQYL